ncbi:formate dehydrogenase accessory sulfurtransferase FdhD [Veillonella intestinalis]|uniref:formate dehydrogenase accessory sulfurtransferase FdhD n=1 Tax=Veillonella intestinalis TaxID=2941341 RepID=UPI002040EFE0|nr:formate dehydrogenase accessory sulfurtransferase FdhD [Veillonella intestinalis]
MYSLSATNHYECISYRQGDGAKQEQLDISQEVAYKLYIENKLISTLIASPHDFRDLIIGYCLMEGHVENADDIASIFMNRETHRIDVTLSHDIQYFHDAAPTSRPQKNNTFTVTADEICSYGGLLDSITKAHHTSHGVHEGAIVKDGEVIAYAEDVGRHNVLDRLLGIIVTKQIDTSDKILIFSGRVPQSVIKKVNRIGVPIMCSRAMPTALGIALAEQYNITLCNVLRPDSFKCMTHPERIKDLCR